MMISMSLRVSGAFRNLECHRYQKVIFLKWKGGKSMSTIPIETVTVIGAGTMGSGIAQIAAANNYRINIVDFNESNLTKCKESINQSVDRVAKKLFKGDSKKSLDYKGALIGRINFTKDISCAKQSQLVIEAIAEDLEKKRKLFKDVEKLTSPTTLLATNTSSISIADLADALKRKENFAGLHFFNPVPVMKLVELIRSPYTSQSTYDNLKAWSKSVGKTVVTCKDTPGFIVNRLLITALISQAVLMLERGDATFEDIDFAVKLGAGFPMGPFELVDYIGVDIVENTLKECVRRDPTEPLFVPPKTLTRMVKEGKLGRKSGQGFYKYEKKM